MQHRHIAKRLWPESRALAMDPREVARFDDVIDLSIGDMDVATDSRIIDAAFADARAGYTRYGVPEGDPELVQAICRYYQEEYRLSIRPEEVYVAASSLFSMELIMMAILNPDDEVLIFSPYFTPYKKQVELAGGVAVEVPTYEADDYAIREDLLRAAITDRTRALILNNPVNPTGAAYDRRTLELLAKVAKEHDLIVVADEIYTSYIFSGEFIPFCSLPEMADRTITLNSFSKNYMMTGWRVGYVLGAPHFTHTLKQINNNMVYSAPAISQRAALHALEIRDSIRDIYISDYKNRVFYAAGRINAIPYLSVPSPKGTFYLFPNIEKTGLTSEEFRKELFEKAHVLVAPGNIFGSTGEGHFRMACTVSMEKLKEAFDRMETLTF